MMGAIRSLAAQTSRARGQSMPELLQAVEGERSPSVLCDVVASNMLTRLEDKQAVLECLDVDQRMKLLLEKLADEIQIGELEERIHARVQEYMDKANHEYYLREQIHAIQEELGEDEDEEVAELRRRIKASKLPPAAREHVEKELKRLARSSVHAPESGVSQNYIEYMLELPWEVYDTSNIDIKKARKVLEADHYGMEDVKRRLIEYLAVRSVASDKLKSPIICLVGPPGVGKTSIAQSIARALDRKFTRLSLGGVHDEAEIRGHRKTYVGAMPGRIISAIRQCKTMNPVFLLDEIDKLSRDMRGDPASAMLEALDPAQNNAFRDHYLEVPFDLSDVLFITTANSLDTIDRALLDRMEVIEVPSYTSEEKLQIAKRHLLPKQREAHNLAKGQLKLSDKAIAALIDGYTRESGVRTLERQIAQLCRRATLHLVERPEDKSVSIKPKDLKEYLGAPRYLRQPVAEQARGGRGQRPGLDQRRRRGHARGGAVLPRQGQHEADRQAGRGHEGIGGAGPQRGARPACRVGRRPGLLRQARHPHPRARGRGAQGRPLGGRGPQLRADVRGDRPVRQRGAGHDRRDHAARQGAAHRRREGKAAGRLSPGHHPHTAAPGEREGPGEDRRRDT